MAIGAYLNVQFPSLDPKWIACGAYIIFMALNILGVGIAATFELIVTLLAIFELLVFMGVVAPGFSWTTSRLTAGQAQKALAPRHCRGCLPPSRLLSGSSWQLKARRWPPKKPKTRNAPFLARWAAAS
jgi:amino acid transporter